MILVEIDPDVSVEQVRALTEAAFRVAEPLLDMTTGEPL